MPQYNLTNTEVRILVTWLFEPNGYLDFAVRLSDNQTAREALAADASLDVTQWTRDHPQQDPVTSSEVAMVWWMRANDQVNVPPGKRPPEAVAWAAILSVWDDSINAGFARASQSSRNDSSITTFGEDGEAEGSVPAGAHLAHQQNIISKVTDVLV